jgi:ferredoxin-NADP reductase
LAAGIPRTRAELKVATVERVIHETPQAVTLEMEVPDWPGHRAGQHVEVRLTAEDGYRAQRSYSIANPPEQAGVAITVERLDDGEVSPYLAEAVREGDQLELRGPIGGWFTWDARDGGPLLLVAGGSGLVPLMSMLRHRRAVGSDAPARLLLSAQRPEVVLYRDELVDLGDDVVTLTYTRAAPTGWTGATRRVDRALLEQVAWPPEDEPRIYVCGPTGFVDVVADELVALGHAPERVRTERFGASGQS